MPIAPGEEDATKIIYTSGTRGFALAHNHGDGVFLRQLAHNFQWGGSGRFFGDNEFVAEAFRPPASHRGAISLAVSTPTGKDWLGMKKSTGFFSPWIWGVYLLLFAVAVPWYWPGDSRAMLLGFPLWVVVTVAMSFVISCFTAWLFLNRWPDFEEGNVDE